MCDKSNINTRWLNHSKEGMGMRRLRVMIFDDEPTVLKMLERFFMKRDYEVLSKTEPVVCPLYDRCADTYTQLDPCADIILTDYKMPRMTGIELLQLQARRGCKLDIRNKAIMSAHVDDYVRKVIHEMGCSYFEKPFKLADISNWLEDCKERIDMSRPLAVLEHQLTN